MSRKHFPVAQLMLMAALTVLVLSTQPFASVPSSRASSLSIMRDADIFPKLGASSNTPSTAVSSGFTFQGSLKQNGSPANGQFDFTFKLFDRDENGIQVGTTLTQTNVTVSGGVYSASLNFGASAFQGDGRWLQVAVRPAGSGSYTALDPRTEIQAAPYAISLVPGAVISGTNSNAIVSFINRIPTGGDGVHGETAASNAGGVYGVNTGGGWGVFGRTTTGIGVQGETSSTGDGVRGEVLGGNLGSAVAGIHHANGIGVYGTAASGGSAGFFEGNVYVTGTCCSMASATTRIDNPLDPANKYLNQSLIQSADMLSVINGNVTLDNTGEAIITVPAWFEAVTGDFRYTLTAIGKPGPNLYIAQELAGNTFGISGGQPGAKVSWQVSGARQDPYAIAHPLQVEQMKPDSEKGFYLHPELYGLPDSQSIDPRLRTLQPLPQSAWEDPSPTNK